MNEQIKQRITQLNNGEVPNGYENTDFGIFPCDWVKDKTFGDLFDFYGGLGKSRDELGDEGHAYLHYGDLHRGSFNVVSHAQYEHLPKYDVTLKGSEAYLMEDGDVAFLDASEDLEGTSRSVLIDNPDNEPFIAGLHVIFGKSKNNSLEKWYKQYITATDSVRKQFQRLASGFKVYGVTRETLPKIQIAYPKSADEQSKIAEILMKWDEAIELYNQYIEKLKQLKSIWLKKMFPQKGERVPEWRFKGFTDAWEQRKLGDVAIEMIAGGDIDKELILEEGRYPVIANALTNDGIVGYYNNEFRIKAPAVTITGRGDVGHAKARIVDFTPVVRLLSIKSKHDVFFLENAINTLKIVVESTGVPQLTVPQLEKYEVVFPKQLAEEEKIGAFFKQLDNLITLHQCKVEKIKAQQKVLQKYLLNGIVRV